MPRIFIELKDRDVINVLSDNPELVGQITVFTKGWLRKLPKAERTELEEEMKDMVSVWGEDAISLCDYY